MMANQLPYLLRMGLYHNGHAAPVSVKNKKKKNVKNIDFVTMANQLVYLSRMGLCKDGQAAPVSVEDGTLSQ